MELLSDWKKRLQDPQIPADFFLQPHKKRFPLLVIKIPGGIGMQDITTISFGALQWHEYVPQGPLVRVPVLICDTLGNILTLNCLLNPKEREQERRGLCARLVSTSYIDIVLVTDTPGFPVIGTKNVYWTSEERKYVQACMHRPVASTEYTRNWINVRKQYAQEHPMRQGILSSLSKKVPLIERYKVRRHVKSVYQYNAFTTSRKPGLYLMQEVGESALENIHRTRKYRLAPSSLAMITYLYHQTCEITLLPSISLWIEGEDLCSLSSSYPSIKALFWYPFVLSEKQDKASHSYQHTWVLEVIDEQGETLVSYYYSPQQHWFLSLDHVCPSNTCHLPSTTKEEHLTVACPGCQSQMDVLVSWFLLTFLVVSGYFAEKEYTEIPPEEPSSLLGITPEGNQAPASYRYQFVHFDASIKKVRPTFPSHSSGKSWLQDTLEVNPEAIVYVNHHIQATHRTLRHERFTYKRDQTIPVKSHEKRIPMKIMELRKKIIQVGAKKYRAPNVD